MRYIVLGAGRQGLAIAYDLAHSGEARGITLVDSDEKAVRKGAARLRKLVRGVRFVPIAQRLSGRGAVGLLRGHAVAVSALPYPLNPALARASVRAGVSFCDLGGNTALVREVLALDGEARAAGVTLVPDCGLAPGLGNVLASMGIREVPGARHVRIRCGGLPVAPRGPLRYSLLFSIGGLTNEYTGEAVVLRDGKLLKLEAFTECEPFRGPRALGRLEAFLTSGGTSTAPWTYRGKLETYDYKTVRYAGHFSKVRAMIDLGLLSLEPVRVGRAQVVPREFFHVVAGPQLEEPGVRDLALLFVEVRDATGRGVRYRMLEYHDPVTGFTAMERTTGYPTAAIAHALARGELSPGAVTPERAGLGKSHLRALRRRGLAIRRERLTP